MEAPRIELGPLTPRGQLLLQLAERDIAIYPTPKAERYMQCQLERIKRLAFRQFVCAVSILGLWAMTLGALGVTSLTGLFSFPLSELPTQFVSFGLALGFIVSSFIYFARKEWELVPYPRYSTRWKIPEAVADIAQRASSIPNTTLHVERLKFDPVLWIVPTLAGYEERVCIGIWKKPGHDQPLIPAESI